MILERIFKKLITEGKLAQGYILFGKPDYALVQRLANFLENGLWENSLAPLIDFQLVSAGDNGSIGIEEIKSASRFLWQTPLKSSRRTLAVSQADKLTPQSQNAILKISEEPPRQSLIFLLVSDPDILVTPLASRFQKIYCHQGNRQESATEIPSEVKIFLASSFAQRRDIIKSIVDDDLLLAKFVEGMMSELEKDPVKNFSALKSLIHRWSLISRYNTNKKLQLESWTQSLTG